MRRNTSAISSRGTGPVNRARDCWRPGAIPSNMRAAAAEEHGKLLTFLGNHVHKMDYPEYLRQGWQIATGAVESACKNVVNRRLCMGGMRWGEFGSDSVAHLRALFRSDPDQWDAFWAITDMAA